MIMTTLLPVSFQKFFRPLNPGIENSPGCCTLPGARIKKAVNTPGAHGFETS
jgi:hypothetical protein